MPKAPITVCIGTYGDYATWSDMVDRRAMPSVERQTLPAAAIRWVHGATLHEARNVAAETARPAHSRSEWICFLDADDELDEHYLEAMTEAIAKLEDGAWLLQPATLGVHPDGHEDPHPVVIPAKPLLDGNFLVIGTLLRQEQFHRLGGFGNWPIYEDWDLWIRCWRDGAATRPVPEAIYRVHVNSSGRNSAGRSAQVRTYNEIRRQYLTAASR